MLDIQHLVEDQNDATLRDYAHYLNMGWTAKANRIRKANPDIEAQFVAVETKVKEHKNAKR